MHTLALCSYFDCCMVTSNLKDSGPATVLFLDRKPKGSTFVKKARQYLHHRGGQTQLVPGLH